MSLDQLLDQQPPIQEITTHARTEKWNELGTQLQLDSVNLAECHSLTSMYQLWIQEKADKATRRSWLDALRAIKQNNAARIYKKYLKTTVSYTVFTSMCIYINRVDPLAKKQFPVISLYISILICIIYILVVSYVTV